MTPLFKKLNLRPGARVLVLDAPESMEPELRALEGVEVARDPGGEAPVEFVLAFVQTLEAVRRFSETVLPRAAGDPTVWLAYPKGTSKRYRCEFNRDTGWAAVGEMGYEPVRQVAVDEDWSALRFRRTGHIKRLTRDPARALSPDGRARLEG